MSKSSPLHDPWPELRARVARTVFGTIAAVAALAAVSMSLADGMTPLLRLLMAGGCAALVLLALSARRLQGDQLELASGAVALLAVLLITVASVGLGWGVNSPAIGAYGLLTAMVCAISTLRLGLLVALASIVSLLGLGFGEYTHLIAGATAVADVPLWRRVLSQVVLVAAGMAAGSLLARIMQHHVHEARDREARFATLLGIAADGYWELDEQLRLTHFSRSDGRGGFVVENPQSPQQPWLLEFLRIDEQALAQHRAALEARRPLRDAHVRAQARDDGGWRELIVSGEPRFDARGNFSGYWGVVRDVSADALAQAALVAAESKYRELFARVPTPLVLERERALIDANDAALRLFGVAALEQLRGHDLTRAVTDAEERGALRGELAALDQAPLGNATPVRELGLVGAGGRRFTVRASAVRVDAGDGPALLIILIDESDRAAAEQAVRRSEALLSNIVSTTPDVITLTDLATGRYAMVNDAFSRLFGHARADTIGRSSYEVEIWARPTERERLAATLRRRRSVRDWPAEFVTRDAQRVPMQVSAAMFQMDGRDYLMTSLRDVSEVERMRRELKAVLDNASVGITLTRHQKLQLVNPRLEQMLGWPQGTLVGRSVADVLSNSANYEQFRDEVAPILRRGEQVEVERELRRRDGSTFICRLLGRAVDSDHPGQGGAIWIAEDVTERHAVAQALAAARDAAEAANLAKSNFLANTSHEIRTPLNGLVGLAQLARRAGLDDARRDEYLDEIVDSAKTLSTIISDILDFSKIEAGKFQLEAVDFDLHAMLRALQRAHSVLADDLGLDLQLEIAPSTPQYVHGDPVRVRQILTNYLTNALKFTRQGSVRISARPAGAERVRFEVVDSGPGISAAEQQRLFLPFSQGDESMTRRIGGTGLGLSICRELATLMSGSVGVDSAPGRGSRFWAELRLPGAPEVTESSGFGTLDSHGPLAGARVLLVEDNAVNMMIGTALLEQWGVQVAQAADGFQAIAAVQQAAQRGERFDAVLMDVQMPEMTGHEAARQLRRTHDATSLPIIALTAAALVHEREEALAAGMNDFLTKPVDARRLHDALVAVIQPREAPTQTTFGGLA